MTKSTIGFSWGLKGVLETGKDSPTSADSHVLHDHLWHLIVQVLQAALKRSRKSIKQGGDVVFGDQLRCFLLCNAQQVLCQFIARSPLVLRSTTAMLHYVLMFKFSNVIAESWKLAQFLPRLRIKGKTKPFTLIQDAKCFCKATAASSRLPNCNKASPIRKKPMGCSSSCRVKRRNSRSRSCIKLRFESTVYQVGNHCKVVCC